MGRRWTPTPKLKVWEWAERHRFLARGTSAKAILGHAPYRLANAPHQREPQESFTDPDVQTTVLVMASQIGGKTEMLNNLVGCFMHQQPGNIIVMYPTVDAAERYSKRKFSPMLEVSPALAGLVAPARSRDSGNTIATKEFTGGAIYFVGSNSPASLRQTSAQVLVGDDVDAFEPSASVEGDPLELLWKRGESYPDAVKVVSSSPTLKGASRVWSWFERSDQRYWFVPCPACGEWQTFLWRQVKWPAGQPELAAYHCIACDRGLDDRARLAMYHAGEWRPTAPFKGIRGYHLNGLYCPWPAHRGYRGRLHQFAEEHARCVASGVQALKVWINTFLCECWEDEATKVDGGDLYKRREAYGPELPLGVLVLTAGADVQADRIEVEIIGWGVGEESWGIQYAVLPGRPDRPDVWRALDALLLEVRPRADGARLTVAAACVDSNAFTDDVHRFTKPRFYRSVVACKGANQHAAPILSALRRGNRLRAPTYHVGTDQAKGLIFARLKVAEPGPGYMHFPRGEGMGYDVVYFSGLTAEEVRVRFHKGFAVREWHKTRARNEPLDCRVYGLAALRHLNPAWGRLAAAAERRRKPPEGPEGSAGAPVTPPVTPPVPPPARLLRRPGFVRGWRRY